MSCHFCCFDGLQLTLYRVWHLKPGRSASDPIQMRCGSRVGRWSIKYVNWGTSGPPRWTSWPQKRALVRGVTPGCVSCETGDSIRNHWPAPLCTQRLVIPAVTTTTRVIACPFSSDFFFWHTELQRVKSVAFLTDPFGDCEEIQCMKPGGSLGCWKRWASQMSGENQCTQTHQGNNASAFHNWATDKFRFDRDGELCIVSD